ncbi:MAG TPA: PfkB family carbohydrate kinase [Amycolatopsis sp.]|nr:PfkB family carbohydrate kinase [Amycolatopsis sp.]
MPDRFDVVVLGEVLVEFHAHTPVRAADTVRLSFSGDALNAAAAAAAAGARTALLTVVGDDELGEALIGRVTELGVHTGLIRRSARPNGAYLLTSDLDGGREFIYWRTASAASTLSAARIESARDVLSRAGALVAGGIAGAISASARAAVCAAAELVHDTGGEVVYDPNFRRRLTTAREARELLAEVLPSATLITPSCPGDTEALLGTDDPAEAVRRCRELGARRVLVTAGTRPVWMADDTREETVPVPANPAAVDATGAGDVLTGTVAARLALGDELDRAVRIGVAAASLSVSGLGGTGHVPALSDSVALASRSVESQRSDVDTIR